MSYFQHNHFLPLFSQSFLILLMIFVSQHGAMLRSPLPSITSSMVLSCLLVWRIPWLPAGLCSTLCCHAGIHEQSSCYQCRPFVLSESLCAGSSTTGPMMVVWVHAIGAQVTLGQHKLPYRVQIQNLVLVQGPPIPSNMPSFLFVTCRVTKQKAMV